MYIIYTSLIKVKGTEIVLINRQIKKIKRI